MLRPRKIFENFGPKSAANRMQSHAPQHGDARDSCWGPLRVVSKLSTNKRHGFLSNLTRFRMKNFAAAKIFENFGPKSAPNRTKSHAAQHADARNRCLGPLKVVRKLRTVRRHGFRRDLARFRTKNFARRENFSKISVENRAQSHVSQHADARH